MHVIYSRRGRLIRPGPLFLAADAVGAIIIMALA